MPVWKRVRQIIVDAFSPPHHSMAAVDVCYEMDSMIPGADYSRPRYTADEVAQYIMAGNDKEVAMMLKNCICGTGAKVWQPQDSEYCKALHKYLPHLRGTCVICKQGGLYVPLINLVCFKRSHRMLTALLKPDFSAAEPMYALEAGVFVTAQDNAGFQAVHIAVMMDFRDGLRDLLAEMEEEDMLHFKQNSPVVLAIQLQSAECLSVLCDAVPAAYLELAYKAYIPRHLSTAQNFNPLQIIFYNTPTWAEGMKVLLEHGVNVNVEDDCGRTPLFMAAVNGTWDIVELLLHYKADIHHTDTHERSILHYAFQPNNKPECRRNESLSQQIRSDESRSYEILKFFLGRGVDPLLQDKGGMTPVDKAIRLKKPRCVEVLLRFMQPMDLLFAVYDMDIIIQYKQIRRLCQKYHNFQVHRPHTVMRKLMGNQVNREVKLWLWTSLWCIVGTGHHLAPILNTQLSFEADMVQTVFSESNQKLYKYLRENIQEFASQPNSLKVTCRFWIRHHLPDVSEQRVKKLPLPVALIQYLLFQDVDEMFEDGMMGDMEG